MKEKEYVMKEKKKVVIKDHRIQKVNERALWRPDHNKKVQEAHNRLPLAIHWP